MIKASELPFESPTLVSELNSIYPAAFILFATSNPISVDIHSMFPGDLYVVKAKVE